MRNGTNNEERRAELDGGSGDDGVRTDRRWENTNPNAGQIMG